jgi:phenylalanine-4-hydroxylase
MPGAESAVGRAGAPLHGAAAGAVAPSADWTIDQGWERYSAAEHALWKRLFERQTGMLRSRACAAFVSGMQALPIGADSIPDFRRLNEVLMRHTGWQVVAVPGLVPDQVFFEHLAHRRFPAGNFLRTPQNIDYLSEPDVFHDVFGHVPMLMHPALADYMQAYGVGGLRAQQLGMLAHLSRVYWYTVEFGLIEEDGALRLYGSGIASSFRESVFCLDDASPNRIRFELERVMRTRYRIDDFQETYFVIRNLDELLELARVDFLPAYQRVQGQAEFEPGEVLAGDGVVHRGSGAYHLARR